jgi:hypothetical protein
VPSDLWLDTAVLSTQACIDAKAAGALRLEQTSSYGLAGARPRKGAEM